MTYTQLTEHERYQIYALKKAGHTQLEIAQHLNRHKSTIHRELKRNQGQRGYRPKQAHERAQARRTGDWEADTVVGAYQGSQPVLVTLTERKTRYTLMIKVTNKTATEVKEKLLEIMSPVMDFVKTITYDNGKEFALHGLISKALKAAGYFAHPYHSWERDLNENTNGLIR